MAIGTRERTELRAELTSQGYSWEYIDEWQPKVTLYRHKDMKSPNGEVVSPAGTALHNLPGSPDYVGRKARIGLFVWPPGQGCQCLWCKEREATGTPAALPPEGQEPRVERGRGQRGKRRMGPHFQQS